MGEKNQEKNTIIPKIMRPTPRLAKTLPTLSLKLKISLSPMANPEILK